MLAGNQLQNLAYVNYGPVKTTVTRACSLFRYIAIASDDLDITFEALGNRLDIRIKVACFKKAEFFCQNGTAEAAEVAAEKGNDFQLRTLHKLQLMHIII